MPFLQNYENYVRLLCTQFLRTHIIVKSLAKFLNQRILSFRSSVGVSHANSWLFSITPEIPIYLCCWRILWMQFKMSCSMPNSLETWDTPNLLRLGTDAQESFSFGRFWSSLLVFTCTSKIGHTAYSQAPITGLDYQFMLTNCCFPRSFLFLFAQILLLKLIF